MPKTDVPPGAAVLLILRVRAYRPTAGRKQLDAGVTDYQRVSAALQAVLPTA